MNQRLLGWLCATVVMWLGVGNCAQGQLPPDFPLLSILPNTNPTPGCLFGSLSVSNVPGYSRSSYEKVGGIVYSRYASAALVDSLGRSYPASRPSFTAYELKRLPLKHGFPTNTSGIKGQRANSFRACGKDKE